MMILLARSAANSGGEIGIEKDWTLITNIMAPNRTVRQVATQWL